ncbi:MAG: fasciclin domain-containing protein [Chloroflexota bacterium]
MRFALPTRLLRGAAMAFSLALATTTLTATFETTPAQAQMQPQMDIVDTAVAAGQFTTLAKALEAGGLVETLKGPGPFTVFAPTDEAFAKVPAADLSQTLQNVDLLRSVLTYHVTAGSMSWAELAMKGQLPTVQGGLVNFNGQDGPKVNGVNVVMSDIKASNGTIHVIDVVLTPPGAGVMNGMAPAPGM